VEKPAEGAHHQREEHQPDAKDEQILDRLQEAPRCPVHARVRRASVNPTHHHRDSRFIASAVSSKSGAKLVASARTRS
jgi:hypothetical protein